jgi:hypothetical protein
MNNERKKGSDPLLCEAPGGKAPVEKGPTLYFLLDPKFVPGNLELFREL